MSLSAMIKAMYANIGQSGVQGNNVLRPTAGDAAGWVSIFRIANGTVIVTGLYAIVTVLHAGAACFVGFRHTVNNTALCALTAAVAPAVGTMFTITGNPNDDAVISTAAANIGAPIQSGIRGSQMVASIQMPGLLMAAGDIQVDWTVVTAGSTRYICTYIPLDPGATLIWV